MGESRRHAEESGQLLLKADEVAKKLSLGRATVYRMIAVGDLPAIRRGRAVRVPVKALNEWIEEETCRRRAR